MTEYWQRSRVTGTKRAEDERNGIRVTDDILHRRGEDPIRMACRRDGRMAECSAFTVDTAEAFQEERHDLPVRRPKRSIPKEERPQWTYADIPD